MVEINEEQVITEQTEEVTAEEGPWAKLAELFESGKSFPITVAEVVKGGLITDIGVRAFIPASLVDKAYVEDLSAYLDTTLEVIITELDQENNRIILSHREVQMAEERKETAKLIKKLKVGEIVEGEVQRIAAFGLFVNIGGVDGLVHISEISWERVDKPEELFKVGDTVKVKIIKVDAENNKISLSIRETLDNPWDQEIKDFKVGAIYQGKVKRLTNFGAFIELSPAIEGLVHVSQISREHVSNPADVLKNNQEVSVKIIEIKPDQKRVGLSIRDAEQEQFAAFSKEYMDNQSLNINLGDLFADKLKELK